MGHRGADLVGDESALDEGVALVAGGAEATLRAGEGEEEFVAPVGAVEAGERSARSSSLGSLLVSTRRCIQSE